MAKGKFDTKGLGAILKSAAQFEQAVQESPVELVKELTNHIIMLPIEHIEANANQPRKDFQDNALEELAASIRVHGLIQPITVRRLHEKAYQIISGERRFRASKLAGLTEIPAYVRIANDQELLEMALIENIQREDLNAIEVALSYSRLKKECNLTDEVISQRVGKDRSTITNHLRLLTLDENIQDAVRDRKISMGHARALAGIKDNAAFLNSLLVQIISESLSVRTVEEMIRKYQDGNGNTKPAPSKRLPEHLRTIQDQFSAFFGAKVQLKRSDKGNGQLVVKFDNDAQLNRLIELIEEK
jgi:ParB family transcriptional regulator, chromosome partitioning protein